jgi:hypothetical protein
MANMSITNIVIFQQDNAAIQKTAAVTTFLTENKTLEWPPQSPDLSIGIY